VAKKKRGKDTPSNDEASLPKVPEKIASPFASALVGMKTAMVEAEKKAAEAKAKPKLPPPPPKKKLKNEGFHEDDATAISLAMHGVKPLDDKRPGRVTTAPIVKSRVAKVAPFGKSNEQLARERLDALVAQDVRFRLVVERDYLEGSRTDAPQRVTRELARRTRASETLDLHGKSAKEAQDEIVRFVRRCHKSGLDVVCIVHGKGQHSEDGRGVLRDATLKALTESFAATLVVAFVTAPEVLGGSGALLVELRH
jgi:DNA-nicking Smr family endonuclease